MKNAALPGLLLLLASTLASCKIFLSPLEYDLKYEYRQYSTSMSDKIQIAKDRLAQRPELIKDPERRARFLAIPAESHGKQICAVTSYYLLLKYSNADGLGDFADYYLRNIDRGYIVETKTKDEDRKGFALVNGAKSATAMLESYTYLGKSLKLLRYEGKDPLASFQSAPARMAVLGRVDENYEGHYFLIFKDEGGQARYADALATSLYGKPVRGVFRTLAWLSENTTIDPEAF
ncbi:MAG: hypothetical protein JNM27_05325 [Leptospirales bacterium]|nr:hypothetical protein [Leptospirales bacterium]